MTNQPKLRLKKASDQNGEETCNKGNKDIKGTRKEEESQRRITKKEEVQTKEVIQKKDVGGVKCEVKGAVDAAKTNNKPACEGGGEKERKVKQKNWINKPKCSIINESVKCTEGTETQGETENVSEKGKSARFREKEGDELDKDPVDATEDKNKVCTGKHEKDVSAQGKVEAKISEISVERKDVGQSASEHIGENNPPLKIETDAFAAKCDTGQSEPDGQLEEATLATNKDGGGGGEEGGGGGEGGGRGRGGEATYKDGAKKQTGSLVGSAGGGHCQPKSSEGEKRGGGVEEEGEKYGTNKGASSLEGLTVGGGQPESCKLEDIEIIVADVREEEKVDTRHLESSCCKEGGEGGKWEGGDGNRAGGKGKRGEGEKIGEYEGEVCKESAADDVNASAEGLHKNVRHGVMRRNDQFYTMQNPI